MRGFPVGIYEGRALLDFSARWKSGGMTDASAQRGDFPDSDPAGNVSTSRAITQFLPEIDAPHWLPYLDPASLGFELLAALQLSEPKGSEAA